MSCDSVMKNLSPSVNTLPYHDNVRLDRLCVAGGFFMEPYYLNTNIEDIPGEEWRDIDGFVGIYKVSNFGRIKTLARKNVSRDMIRKQVVDRIGYMRVQLSKNGRKESGGFFVTKLVHRLVAIAFIDNTNNYPDVNHKDLNKKNNHIYNLEWCTKSYNQIHLYKFGGRVAAKAQLGKFGFDSFRSRHVNQFDLNGNLINTFGSLRDALRNVGGKSTNNIIISCRNTGRPAYGYLWGYKN